MIKRKLSIHTISLCFICCLTFILIYFATEANIFTAKAETLPELPSKEQMDLFTDSDYLYDAHKGKVNMSYTIDQYDDLLWGVKTENDDMITQIIPRECFYNVCSFTHVGKEYGFYISTESNTLTDEKTGLTTHGYKTDVFVFDISTTLSSTANEFSYKVTPLYVYNYYSDDNGVRPQTTNKPNLSDLYYITNVNYGFTVLNENSYNSQDQYGYTKEKDNGPVILQTRYNSRGYDGAEWQGDIAESVYIAISRFGGYIPVIGKYIDIATDIIDAVKDSAEISKLVVWDKKEVANNNELNIITYKDKYSYDSDETYYRSSVILADGEIVYKAGNGHYSEGVLLLSSIENTYRVYDQIQLDIATVSTTGNRTIISSGTRTNYTVRNNSLRESITAETSNLAYTLPYGEKKYSFIPEYTGYYQLNHNTTGKYTYYIYPSGEPRGSSLSETTDVFFEKGNEYFIDVVSLDNDIYADTFELSLQAITKSKSSTVSLNPNRTISLKYDSDTTEILDLNSSNSSITIKQIINLNNSNDSIFSVNAQTVSKKVWANNTYIIELENQSADNTISAVISINEASLLPKSYNPCESTHYFAFNATSAAYYLFSFKYDVSKLGVEIINSTLSNKTYEEGFGPGYKTVKVYLNANEKIYIGLYDVSKYQESIEIKYSFDSNAYKWKVNGSVISGNSIELEQGQSATLELIINDSISVKSFQIDNADYKFTTVNNTITLDDHCRIANYFEVKAVLEDSGLQYGVNLLSVNKFYSKSLFITPILGSSYTINTFNNNDGFGIFWSNDYISSIEFNIMVGNNNKSITVSNTTRYNIMSIIKGWNYKSPDKISITINRIQVKGLDKAGEVYDWVNNNTRGFSVPILYINALFGSGDGTESSPFIITCQRQLKNISEIKIVDDIDIMTFVGGYFFKLGNDISLSGAWEPIGFGTNGFVGVFDGGFHTINGLSISVDDDNYYGLFSISRGTIKNLTLKSVNINVDNQPSNHSNGTLAMAGALCGYNKSQISDVKVYGTVSGSGRVVLGGIVGGGDCGDIYNSTNYATIYGGYDMGGIVGSTGGMVRNCYSYGSIIYNYRYEDHDCIGGIAGSGDEAKISECVVSAKIIISVKDWESRTYQPYVGAVVGSMYKGTVSGNNTSNAIIDKSNLNPDVSWWSWFVTYHFNQQEYVKSDVGHTDN